MTLIELIFTAIGLAMDAFAAAALKGLSAEHPRPGRCFSVSLCFGLFQALMPCIGYWLGARFSGIISGFDHWISFFILAIIGANMIVAPEETAASDTALSFRALAPLALATSADALAAGVGFAFLNMRILPSALLIGAVTFLLSAVGFLTGGICGSRMRSSASRGGGFILLLMGSRLLITHLI